MRRIAIVCINHVTRGTTRRTIIAWMIIRAEKVECRIEQTRFLYPEENRIGALCGAETARAESFVRLARIFFLVRQTNLEPALPTPLKHTEHISGLRNLPAGQWIEQTQKAFCASLFVSGCLQ